jgi:hypothetical protein
VFWNEYSSNKADLKKLVSSLTAEKSLYLTYMEEIKNYFDYVKNLFTRKDIKKFNKFFPLETIKNTSSIAQTGKVIRNKEVRYKSAVIGLQNVIGFLYGRESKINEALLNYLMIYKLTRARYQKISMFLILYF